MMCYLMVIGDWLGIGMCFNKFVVSVEKIVFLVILFLGVWLIVML